MLYSFWLIARYFIYFIPVEGWTSVIVSIYFIGGLLFANLGILGLYIGSFFEVPTINQRWYDPTEMTKAEVFTRSGLKNIKCI